MTPFIRMSPGEIWEYRGQRLVFQQELGGELLHFSVEKTLAPFQVIDLDGSRRTPDRMWLMEVFAAGDMHLVRRPFNAFKTPREHAPDLGVDEILEKDLGARRRAFVTRGLDQIGDIPRGEAAMRRALNQLWAQQPEKASQFAKPHPRSAIRWLDGRGMPDERRLRDMLSLSGRCKRRPRLAPLVRALIFRCALWFWSARGWSQADAYARLRKRIWYINQRRARGRCDLPLLERPGKETFRKAIRGLECYDTYCEKYGEKSANTHFKPNERGLTADRFLRLGCMDHTILDSVVVIDANWMLPVGRPTLTVLLDVYTRCVVGFVVSFEPPSIYSVTECVKRANRPKLHSAAYLDGFLVLGWIFGRFDEIVVDNGKEFVGTSLEDGFADIGITLRFAPVASPQHKAVGERFFGTLNQLLNKKVPGGVLKPEAMRAMDYDPAKDAVLTIEQLEALIWETLRFYHIDVHEGVGAPPALLWQKQVAAHGVDVIGDERELDKMLGAIKYPCRLSRSGVELFGLKFHDPDKTGRLLEDLVSYEPIRPQAKGSARVTVKVKYNPADISQIHVWNRRRNHYVSLPCTQERYAAGISLWHHRKIREWADAENLAFSSEDDRLLARTRVIEQVEACAPNLKAASRRAMARLFNSPKVQELTGGSVHLAYAQARHDGLAPVIEHGLPADDRTDQGLAPTRPARSSRPKSTPKRSRPATEKTQSIRPETGVEADFTVDFSDWTEIEL